MKRALEALIEAPTAGGGSHQRSRKCTTRSTAPLPSRKKQSKATRPLLLLPLLLLLLLLPDETMWGNPALAAAAANGAVSATSTSTMR